jgi:hypothetical protein
LTPDPGDRDRQAGRSDQGGGWSHPHRAPGRQRRCGELAQQAADDAGAVLANARRALARIAGRQRGRLHNAITELSTLLGRARQVVAQIRRRVAGDKVKTDPGPKIDCMRWQAAHC